MCFSHKQVIFMYRMLRCFTVYILHGKREAFSLCTIGFGVDIFVFCIIWGKTTWQVSHGLETLKRHPVFFQRGPFSDKYGMVIKLRLKPVCNNYTSRYNSKKKPHATEKKQCGSAAHNREYLALQICKMNSRFRSEFKLPFSQSHWVLWKLGQSWLLPFSRLFASSEYLRKRFPPLSGLKHSIT